MTSSAILNSAQAASADSVQDRQGGAASRVELQLGRLEKLGGFGMKLAGRVSETESEPGATSVADLNILCLAYTRVSRAIRQNIAMEQEMLGLRPMRSVSVRSVQGRSASPGPIDMRDRAARIDRGEDFRDRDDLADPDDLDDLDEDELDRRINAELDRVRERQLAWETDPANPDRRESAEGFVTTADPYAYGPAPQTRDTSRGRGPP